MQELLASQVKYTWNKIQGSRLIVISPITSDWKQDWWWLKKIQDGTRMKQFKRQRNQEMSLDLFECMEFDNDVHFFCFGQK